MSKKRAIKKTARKKTTGTTTKRATTRKQTTHKRAPARKRATAGKQAEKKVVVTVGDAHMSNIKIVAAALRSRGMKVDSVLEATGMITGAYSKPASTLKRVQGVTSVEEQPQFQLPPPDSEVQ